MPTAPESHKSIIETTTTDLEIRTNNLRPWSKARPMIRILTVLSLNWCFCSRDIC